MRSLVGSTPALFRHISFRAPADMAHEPFCGEIPEGLLYDSRHDMWLRREGKEIVIGATSFVLTVVGAKLGPVAGRLAGRRAELLGGLILIGIGVKILVEHLAG
jgi:hypothetical protein